MVLAPPRVQSQQPQYEITETDRARQELIRQAWAAYDGKLDPPLQKMPNQPDDNVLSNRCAPVVDRGVDFLFGLEVEISCEDDAPTEAQDLLDKTWGRKEARIPLLQKLAMSGAMAGQAFLRIVPNRDGTFRLIVVDPATVYVKTAPQDCETVLLYCIEYSVSEKRDGRPSQTYYREEMARMDPDSDENEQYEDISPDGLDADVTWQIQHWTQTVSPGMQPKATNWTAAGAPISWPYPFPPLFSCQNLPRPNDFWGVPDITPGLIGLNNALNLVQSNIARIIKLYGAPIICATGTGETVIDIKPGRIIGLPLTESKVFAVPLPNDITHASAFAADLRSDTDEESSTPGVATGRISTMPRGNLSGIAIELLFMPILKKTDKKRNTYGELLIDVSKAILVLNNMNGEMDITIAWQDSIPHDDLVSVQAAIAKKELSISNQTLQRELGYDPEEEFKLSQAEDEQKIEQAAKMAAVMPTAIPGTPPLPNQQKPMSAQPGQGGQPK